MVMMALSLVALTIEGIWSIKPIRPYLLAAGGAAILWYVASRFAEKVDDFHPFDDWVAAITFAVLLPTSLALGLIHLTTLTHQVSWQWIAIEALVATGGLARGATAAARPPAYTS